MGTKRNPEWPESPDKEKRGREMKPEKSATVRYLDTIPRTMESDGLTLSWGDGSKHLLVSGLHCFLLRFTHSFIHSLIHSTHED